MGEKRRSAQLPLNRPFGGETYFKKQGNVKIFKNVRRSGFGVRRIKRREARGGRLEVNRRFGEESSEKKGVRRVGRLRQ